MEPSRLFTVWSSSRSIINNESDRWHDKNDIVEGGHNLDVGIRFPHGRAEQRCCCFIMRHTKKVFVPLRTISWLIFVFPLLLLQCSLGEWVNLFSKFRFTSFTSENGVVQFKTQFPVLLLCRTAKGSRLYSNRLHAFWYQRSSLFWGSTAEKY